MRILRKSLIVLFIIVSVLFLIGWWVVSGDPAKLSMDDVTGTDPVLAAPDEQMIPTVGVARPVGWADGEAPSGAEGLVVNRFAEGIEHPRVIYTLPNGDVLVALANAPGRVVAGGGAFTNWVAGLLFSRAGAAMPSPDKLVLLRDADQDGVAEEQITLRDDLSSPSGIAWRDGNLYVANHDAVLRFDYQLGGNLLEGDAEKLMDLPAAGNHWMRNIIIDKAGEFLYIAVGSASNIGEAGMEIEKDRAAILRLNLESGKSTQFGDGLRNPNGLAWSPWSGDLWTTVNERDMLGSDLVPDYLTDVPIGARYGWPWLYYNDVVDDRVEAPMPNFLPEYTRTPKYALGPHVAALGVVFTQEGSKMGAGFGNGAFVARHGSWNRKPASGYDVVFIPFDKTGNPTGMPITVLDSFLVDGSDASGETRGRPTWVAWDQTGALLVSDDTANIIWRVMDPSAEGAAAIAPNTGGSLPPQRELIGDPARAFEQIPEGLEMGNFL